MNRYLRMLADTHSMNHARQTPAAQYARQSHRYPNRLCLAMFPIEDNRLGQNIVQEPRLKISIRISDVIVTHSYRSIPFALPLRQSRHIGEQGLMQADNGLTPVLGIKRNSM